jgi:SAM-dependent methyltransferase
MSEPVSSPDNIPFELTPQSVQLPEQLTGALLADAGDAAIFETFVIPNYLSLFGEAALAALESVGIDSSARIAHVLSRTGYPDREIARRAPGVHIHGFDPSPFAVDLATVKASSAFDFVAEYAFASALPSPLPSGVFSHGLVLHPIVSEWQRVGIHRELLRLLRPGGHAIFAMPVRGSFLEIYDLLREYGLKHESVDLEDEISRAIELRPTVEAFAAELEREGFVDVDVGLQPTSLTFRNARDFFESPATRLLVLPDIQAALADAGDPGALAYVRDAIDKYWSDSDFELTLNIACASSRKP